MQRWAQDLQWAGLLTGVFLVLLVLAEGWSRWGGAKPEWTRKLVHLAGGVACLAFPFLIESAWVVLVMAVGLAGLFALGAKTGALRSLHGVGRKTRGSEYYPLAIFLVFGLASGRPWLYVCSVLVLAVADAFAALVGGRYGVIRYQVEDEYKSLEGSMVFLLIAFLAIHLPMLLLSDLPREVCVLAALLTAVLATGFEAISLRGADNLFVPIGVCLILMRITTKPVAEIVYQNLSLLGICLVVALLVKRSRSFNTGGTIAFVLFTFGAWSLGSHWWALPVLVGFLVYTLAWVVWPARDGRWNVKVRTVTRALIVPFLFVVAGNVSGKEETFFGPFVCSLGAVLAMSLWNHMVRHCSAVKSKPLGESASPGRMAGRWAWACGAGLLAWLGVVWGPAWIGGGATSWGLALIAGLCVAVALVDEAVMTLRSAVSPVTKTNDLWTATRFLLTAWAAVMVLLLQAGGLVQPWRLP